MEPFIELQSVDWRGIGHWFWPLCPTLKSPPPLLSYLINTIGWLIPQEKAVVGRGTSEGSYSSGHSAVWLATSNQDSHSNRPTLAVTFQQLCNSVHGTNNIVPVQLMWHSTHFARNFQKLSFFVNWYANWNRFLGNPPCGLLANEVPRWLKFRLLLL